MPKANQNRNHKQKPSQQPFGIPAGGQQRTYSYPLRSIIIEKNRKNREADNNEKRSERRR
jgi:hypothetical protein